MTKVLLLRTIPIIGWIFLVYGAIKFRSPSFRHPLVQIAWYLDLFLSLIIHPAQIPFALRNSPGQPPGKTAFLTMIFGLTWWKTQPDQSKSLEKKIH